MTPTAAQLAQIPALQATIAQLTSVLNSGVKKSAENGRLLELDLSVVREQLNAATEQLAYLQMCRPQIRHLFVSTPSRGY